MPPLWSSGQSSWLLNRGVFCYLWGTNWIYICYIEENRPPLWSSGQSSWLLNGGVLCYHVEESRPSLWSSGQSSWLLNGGVFCYLRGTNWIYLCYVEESRPPLWSSAQSSWLHIQRSGFDSRCYQISWKVVGLEWSPLSLVSTIEELLERNSSCPGLEIREYGSRDPLRWPPDTINPLQLALTSPTSGCRSVGIVRLWTQATEFVLFVFFTL
jgi:hypothetical protein